MGTNQPKSVTWLKLVATKTMGTLEIPNWYNNKVTFTTYLKISGCKQTYLKSEAYMPARLCRCNIGISL